MAGDVAVNVIWGRLGNVAAAGSTSTATATASVSTLGVTCRADRTFDAVEQGTGGLVFAAALYKREADGLAFGVGAVKFADGFMGVF